MIPLKASMIQENIELISTYQQVALIPSEALQDKFSIFLARTVNSKNESEGLYVKFYKISN